MKRISFGPIANKRSKILILGTIPSEESIRKKERYGHKSNQFWRILFSIFNEPFPDNYEEKEKILIDNDIAIWDVLHSCDGNGSLDSNIKEEEANDFALFYKEYPQIKHIFFTSKKAAEFYKKYVGFEEIRPYTILPSPSPANARMTFEEKAKAWKILKETLDKLKLE